jgi:hypothetical protein
MAARMADNVTLNVGQRVNVTSTASHAAFVRLASQAQVSVTLCARARPLPSPKFGPGEASGDVLRRCGKPTLSALTETSHTDRPGALPSALVTGVVQRPTWPSDPEHREAIDTLLTMAEAEHRWGDSSRAVDLLDNVEQIVGALPEDYETLRRRCRGAALLPA